MGVRRNKTRPPINPLTYDGSFQILVATDIAARNIDVSLISHVINYDIPDTVPESTRLEKDTGLGTQRFPVPFCHPPQPAPIKSLRYPYPFGYY